MWMERTRERGRNGGATPNRSSGRFLGSVAPVGRRDRAAATDFRSKAIPSCAAPGWQARRSPHASPTRRGRGAAACGVGDRRTDLVRMASVAGRSADAPLAHPPPTPPASREPLGRMSAALSGKLIPRRNAEAARTTGGLAHRPLPVADFRRRFGWERLWSRFDRAENDRPHRPIVVDARRTPSRAASEPSEPAYRGPATPWPATPADPSLLQETGATRCSTVRGGVGFPEKAPVPTRTPRSGACGVPCSLGPAQVRAAAEPRPTAADIGVRSRGFFGSARQKRQCGDGILAHGCSPSGEPFVRVA